MHLRVRDTEIRTRRNGHAVVVNGEALDLGDSLTEGAVTVVHRPLTVDVPEGETPESVVEIWITDGPKVLVTEGFDGDPEQVITVSPCGHPAAAGRG